jgi:ATP-dependent RNA helicase RhlE
VPETYVHRIGRTGRAGASGQALSFCDYEEKALLKDIQKLILKTIPVINEHPYAMSAPLQDMTERTSGLNKPRAGGARGRHNIFRPAPARSR